MLIVLQNMQDLIILTYQWQSMHDSTTNIDVAAAAATVMSDGDTTLLAPPMQVTTSPAATSVTLALDMPEDTILAGIVTESTRIKYLQAMRHYLTYAGSREAALNPATLARWRSELAATTEQTANTINNRVTSVKRFMVAAAEQGYLSHELAHAFERVRGVAARALKERRRPYNRTRITPTQMRRICDAPLTLPDDRPELLRLRDAALLATLASSGVRLTEAATLRAEQIEAHPDGGYQLRVLGKTDTEPRVAPLSREAKAHIDRWLRRRGVHSPYLFVSFGGRGRKPTTKPMSDVAIWKLVRGYAEAVGVPHVKPHDFRRFVGTQLTRQDIRKAQKALGHKNISTTTQYDLDDIDPGLTDALY